MGSIQYPETISNLASNPHRGSQNPRSNSLGVDYPGYGTLHNGPVSRQDSRSRSPGYEILNNGPVSGADPGYRYPGYGTSHSDPVSEEVSHCQK